MQAKSHSVLEAIANVSIGYIVAISSQLLLFPFFDINVSIMDNVQLGGWFTAISLARSYLLRRIFANLTDEVMQ